MPISLEWLDDRQSILVWKLYGDWTLEEFGPYLDQSYDMCNSVDHWVNSIAIDNDTEKLINLMVAANTQRNRPDPKNYDMAAFVVKESTHARMLKIMSESPVPHGKLRVFHDYDEALAFVEQRQLELQGVAMG